MCVCVCLSLSLSLSLSLLSIAQFTLLRGGWSGLESGGGGDQFDINKDAIFGYFAVKPPTIEIRNRVHNLKLRNPQSIRSSHIYSIYYTVLYN